MARPSRYSPEVRERAVRMVFDHRRIGRVDTDIELRSRRVTGMAHSAILRHERTHRFGELLLERRVGSNLMVAGERYTGHIRTNGYLGRSDQQCHSFERSKRRRRIIPQNFLKWIRPKSSLFPWVKKTVNQIERVVWKDRVPDLSLAVV